MVQMHFPWAKTNVSMFQLFLMLSGASAFWGSTECKASTQCQLCAKFESTLASTLARRTIYGRPVSRTAFSICDPGDAQVTMFLEPQSEKYLQYSRVHL
uniref:Secreted protein n=1 Tax=Rhipicephalus appendiculatus TaxID=34631 RepID=A0A131YBX3_RHIAP